MLGEGVSGRGVWNWRQHQQRGDELASADCSQAKPADAMLLAAARPISIDTTPFRVSTALSHLQCAGHTD